jgi:hypothetical protein
VKALFCGRCSSIHSGPVDGTWRFCDCGQAAVRWADSTAGQLQVWSSDLEKIRVIGLNNSMIYAAFGTVRGITGTADEQWRLTHDQSCADARGYLFHTSRRDCWAVIVAPHESGDVAWLTERPSVEAT